MERIEKLTEDQIAALPRYRDEWLAKGLATGPVDRDRAEQVIDDVYRAGGLEPPIVKIWLRSPREGAIGAALLAGGSKFGDQVGAQVWDQVGAQVGAQVRDQVGAQVWAQVRAQVWAQVRAQVWDQVGAQVRDQVGDQVRAQVWAQVWAQAGAQVYRAGWGAHDAAWLSFYSFFLNECGLKSCARMTPLMELADCCGWFWPFQRAVILTERPDTVKMSEGRLHCEDGPAIRYADGLAVHAWRGTRIPAEWVEDRKSLTAKTALTWENIEQRRCALEIVGWHNVLRELSAKVIDEDADLEHGALVEVQLPDLDRPSRFIHARCGTKREFAIGVPPEINTVLEAQAWLTGLPVETFQFPTLRT